MNIKTVAAPTESRRSVAVALGVMVFVWALIYLPWLGAHGLSMSEGHRAIPGWSMLDSGQWLVPELFERIYIRKPPGMPWAVAISSALFGVNEFGARFPSAIATLVAALASFAFARRWFGRRAGLAAGLAIVTMPLLWSPGRSAEIEAINNCATLIAALSLLDLMLATSSRHRWMIACVGAASIFVMVAAKGPAGAVTVIAAPLGAAWATGAWRRLMRAALLFSMLAGGGAGLALLWMMYARAMSMAHEPSMDPVVQSPTEFMWSSATALKVLAMPFVALASAMPWSLALLFPWWRDAINEPPANVGTREGVVPIHAARAVAATVLVSVLVLAVMGVHNPRYAMPSLVLCPMLVGYVWAAMSGGWLTPARARIARVMSLGHAMAWPALLTIAAVVWIGVQQRRGDDLSGRVPGAAMALRLADGDEVLADALVEARPDVLWYAQRDAAALGKRVRVRWVSRPWESPQRANAGSILALRFDGRGDEVSGAGDELEAWTSSPSDALPPIRPQGYLVRLFRHPAAEKSPESSK